MPENRPHLIFSLSSQAPDEMGKHSFYFCSLSKQEMLHACFHEMSEHGKMFLSHCF